MKVLNIFVCATAMTLAMGASSARAQSITLGGKDVQVHGSFQQGFAVSDNNNFLTMDTTSGSGAMTDGALNVSSQLTSKLRVGGQLYTRKIGELGGGQLQVDWAYADYRFAKAFGIRAGKVKTALGLFNDTQDMEFLYTWALLPQGVYPADLRGVTIAHVGGDVYGTIDLKKSGALSYTAHYGRIPDDPYGGYRYGVNDAGIEFSKPIETKGYGADVRWTAPVDGVIAGYSLLSSSADTNILYPVPGRPGLIVPIDVYVSPWRRQAIFGDVQRGSVHASAELRLDYRAHTYTPELRPDESFASRGWFVSGAYRVSTHLEVGSYYTHYIPDESKDTSLPSEHSRDAVATARIDINRFWNVKVEAHFMDGYGQLDSSFARGFYLRDNTTPSATTNMLVIRTGVNF
jgi:hypothetical protein